MENQPERVVLDRDDLRRTLVRIAHEIVEKNPDLRRPVGSGREAEQPTGLARRDPHPRRRPRPAACTRWSAS